MAYCRIRMNWLIGFFVLILSAGFSACKYEFPAPAVDYRAGNIDLTTFISVGDDYLSGFMDGALYDAGQQNSIAAIMAKNFEKAGLQSFHQADINALNGYNEYASDQGHLYGKYILVYPDDQAREPDIVTTPGDPVKPYTGDKDSLDDFVIPFMKIYEIDDPGLDLNKYYHRIASNPSASTLLSQVDRSGATFFVLWMGMSDILGYATSGGSGDSLPVDLSNIKQQDLTPPGLFEEKLDLIVSTLLKKPGSKGIILTLPAFDDFPYFYYYPYNFIKLPGPKLPLAVATYSQFNEAVSLNNQNLSNPKRPYISFNDNGATPYPQPVVVSDTSLPDAYYPDGRPLEKIRQLNPNEMVLMGLPRKLLEYGLGSLIPLPEKYYLKEPVIKAIRSRVQAFNEIILRKAGEYPDRLQVVDISESIHAIAETGKLNGWGRPASFDVQYIDGVPLNGRLGLNSIFSLDGLHLNQRGNAYIANEIMRSANRFFQCTLPAVDVNNYKGNVPLY